MRGRETVSTDGETEGEEKFVVVDQIPDAEGGFVIIIEAKRMSVGVGMKQCLLSMKDVHNPSMYLCTSCRDGSNNKGTPHNFFFLSLVGNDPSCQVRLDSK